MSRLRDERDFPPRWCADCGTRMFGYYFPTTSGLRGRVMECPNDHLRVFLENLPARFDPATGQPVRTA